MGERYLALRNMRIATESANVFSGSKAIEFSLPISTTEMSCSLWKVLSPEQDTVFMRMYQKFDSGLLGADFKSQRHPLVGEIS